MPLQRRLPKFGFTSRVSFVSDQVTLSEIAKVEGDVVSLETLKAAGLIKKEMQNVKVFLSGSIDRAVTISGLRVSKGALEAIVAAGGKVEE
jgi:large subunit ribosomal protein L15